jgi:hypothetical protein
MSQPTADQRGIKKALFIVRIVDVDKPIDGDDTETETFLSLTLGKCRGVHEGAKGAYQYHH